MSSIYTGVSGMQAYQQAVQVVANNVANLNTVAFKAGRITFEETLTQRLFGGSEAGTNPMEIGKGVTIASIDKLMGQGNMQQTGRSLDLAIAGDTFFVVNNPVNNSIHYTRNGSFQLDANNRLVMSSNGMSVVGWQADPFTGLVDVTAAPGVLHIPLGSVTAIQTTTASIDGNLNASAAMGDTTSASITVYDSQGTGHQIDVEFEKTDAGEWTWTATSPDADAGTTPGSGTLIFDENGVLTSSAGTISLDFTPAGGATSPLVFTMDFGAMTQLDGTSTVQPLSQDGAPMGSLQNIFVSSDGLINGTFTNGATKVLGQLATARFANIAGLSDEGNGLWNTTLNSGTAIIQSAQDGNSIIRSGFLEMSNVDLTNEFANLIVFQRGFQANSRSITTSDEMMQDVLQLKR
ncbi:MAG: flagellar hook protein FlgE [Armatimonadota bacterium]